ncbi:Ammecr1l, partial [Acrasis kona]
MSVEATQDMCRYCFDTLLEYLESGNKMPKYTPKFSNEDFPLFVTWNKKNSKGEYSLRGCIGTFSEQPLHRTLANYAITSAVHDSRFNPITKSELPDLKCSVSLLVNFEDGDDVYDWEIGTHGIRISFVNPSTGRESGATYLPEVCSEQEWTKEECLESLYRKAGYRGKLNKELLESTHLEKYQSTKSHIEYNDYIKL